MKIHEQQCNGRIMWQLDYTCKTAPDCNIAELAMQHCKHEAVRAGGAGGSFRGLEASNFMTNTTAQGRIDGEKYEEEEKEVMTIRQTEKLYIS
jgi:hypothetical protein